MILAKTHPFKSNFLRELPSPGLFGLESQLHYELSWDATYPSRDHSAKWRDIRQSKLCEVRAELIRREEEGEL